MKRVLQPKRLRDLDAQSSFDYGSAIRALRAEGASTAEVSALERRLDAQLATPTAVGSGAAAVGLGAKWAASLLMAFAVGLYVALHLAREPVRPDARTSTAPLAMQPPRVAPDPPPALDHAIATDAPAPLVAAPAVKLSRHERPHAALRAVPPRAGVAPEAELALLQQAQAALDHDAAGALALAEQHARLYPRGLFTQEREILAIEAQLKLRQRSAAVARAQAFVQRYPDSPHARRVRSLLERSQRAAEETIGPGPDHSTADTQQ